MTTPKTTKAPAGGNREQGKSSDKSKNTTKSDCIHQSEYLIAHFLRAVMRRDCVVQAKYQVLLKQRGISLTTARQLLATQSGGRT